MTDEAEAVRKVQETRGEQKHTDRQVELGPFVTQLMSPTQHRCLL
jgi:hypothetical protein